MPPPQCPECGRFLATAFVQQITTSPAPCPRCGTELSLAGGGEPTSGDTPADEVGGAPAAPEEEALEDALDAATSPDGEAPGSGDDEDVAADDTADADDADDDAAAGGTTQVGGPPAAPEEEALEDPSEDAPPVPPPSALADVSPEPTTSVRPPDRDPLEGWDEGGTRAVEAPEELDPTVLAAGAGAGLLLGLLLGGRDHRGLGALLGAALGAVLARLRG